MTVYIAQSMNLLIYSNCKLSSKTCFGLELTSSPRSRAHIVLPEPKGVRSNEGQSRWRSGIIIIPLRAWPNVSQLKARARTSAYCFRNTRAELGVGDE